VSIRTVGVDDASNVYEITLDGCTFVNNTITDQGDGGSVAIGNFNSFGWQRAGPEALIVACSFTNSSTRQTTDCAPARAGRGEKQRATRSNDGAWCI